MTGAVATFSASDFKAAFPEFSALTDAQAEAFFNRAAMFWRNDGSGLVATTAIQTNLMYLLTAHIAWLNAPRDANGNPAATGTPPPPIVGRITSATEGSVSVQAQADYAPGTPQWYQQTRYGSEFWAASQAYRSFRYFSRKTRVYDGLLTRYPSSR